MPSWELHFDGSSKHGAGYFGYVLVKDKIEVDRGHGQIGLDIKPKTAEKYAMAYGLDSFIRNWSEPGTLTVFGDAKQVIESVDNDPDLSPKIEMIRGWGVPVTFKWIPRDQNQLANDLARKMIDYSRRAGAGPRTER